LKKLLYSGSRSNSTDNDSANELTPAFLTENGYRGREQRNVAHSKDDFVGWAQHHPTSLSSQGHHLCQLPCVLTRLVAGVTGRCAGFDHLPGRTLAQRGVSCDPAQVSSAWFQSGGGDQWVAGAADATTLQFPARPTHQVGQRFLRGDHKAFVG